MALSTQKHRNELLKIIDDDEALKNYIVNLYKNNYNIKQISQIFAYPDHQTVQSVLKERDIKKCSSGSKCKSPNGPFLSRIQFYSDSNKNDGKNWHCSLCDNYRQLYRKAPESKKKLMDYYQSLDNKKDQINFIIYVYKKLGDYHKVSKIVFCDILYIVQIMQNENIKKCTCCGKIKYRNEFGSDKTQKDGLPRFCKLCINFNAFYKKLDSDQQSLMLEFHNLNDQKLENEFIFNLYYNHHYTYQFIRGLVQKSTQSTISIIKEFDLKRCTKCEQFKSFSEFADANTPDGKTHQCKKCTNQYFQDNPLVKKKYRDTYNQENHEKILEYSRMRNNSFAKFDAFASKIELYHEVRRDPDNQESLQVKCKLCDTWFTPTVMQVENRYNAINGKMRSIGTENHLYCSNNCKGRCLLYHTSAEKLEKDLKFQAGRFNPDDHRRMQSTLRTFIISQFGAPDHCDKCGDPKDVSELILHHKEPVSIVHIFEADRDNLMWECSECHTTSHNIEGCHPHELSELVYC